MGTLLNDIALADTPKMDTPQNYIELDDTPQTGIALDDTPENDIALVDTQQNDAELTDIALSETPQNDSAQNDTPLTDKALAETPKNYASQNGTPLTDISLADSPQNDAAQNDTPLTYIILADKPQNDASQKDTPLTDIALADTPQNDSALNDTPLTDTALADTPQNDAAQNDTPLTENLTTLNIINIDNFPNELTDDKLINYLVILTFLTFKITVNITSQMRKKKFRTNARAGLTVRVGAGTLNDTRRCSVSKQCSLMELSPELDAGTIYILTSRLLVYNEEEALAATVDFFINGRSHRLPVSDVLPFPDPEDESCLLVCEGISLNLMAQLKEYQDQLQSLQRNFPQHIKERLPGYTFWIHPPEARNQLVLCSSSKVKVHRTRSTDDQDAARSLGLELQSYTRSTSIGALIITFKYDVSTSECKMNLEMCKLQDEFGAVELC